MNCPRRIRSFLFLTILGMGARLQAASTSGDHPPSTDPGGYKGAIIVDAASGRALFEDHSRYRGAPASMTKLMTFAVLTDFLNSGRLTLQTPVTVTAADSRMGGSQVWLKEGEVFPVEELLYAMMVQSANDAAYALARTAAGTVPAFVELMNAKARELGMDDSTFRSPHGLPPPSGRTEDGDLSSPRDMALLSRYLLMHTDVLQYSSVRLRDFGIPPRSEAVQMVNHNHLLGKVDGVDGLKTGFTDDAGSCLAATAQRNGRRIIVVAMGGESAAKRDAAVKDLIEWGFAALPLQTNPAGTPVIPVPSDQNTPVVPAPKPPPAEPDSNDLNLKLRIP